MDPRKLLSKLTKSEINSLPGFSDNRHSYMTLKDLKAELTQYMIDHRAYRKGLTVHDYVKLYKSIPKPPPYLKPLTRYADTHEYKYQLLERKRKEKKADDELFKSLEAMKRSEALESLARESFNEETKYLAKQERIRENTILADELKYLDISKDRSDQLNREYRKRIKLIKNRKKFTSRIAKWTDNVNHHISFEVTIGDNEEKRLAFCEVLRYVITHPPEDENVRDVVKATTLDGKHKYFTLHDRNIESLIGHISGEIDLQTDESDTNPFVVNTFLPVKYELMFVNANSTKSNKKGSHKGKSFTKKVKKPESKLDEGVKIVELELDSDFRELLDGSFFRYINTTAIDLSRYQIYNSIKASNYRDCCFVHACLESKIFTDEEMDAMRRWVLTRDVPQSKIKEIAIEFKCHFIVKHVDENRDIKHQTRTSIDTRKLKCMQDLDIPESRCITLLLFKDHYMINDDDTGYSTYYVSNSNELDSTFSSIPIDKRRLIQRVRNGIPDYAKKGVSLIYLLRFMFKNDMFKELNACEEGILSTCEYRNHLKDYRDLEYDQKQCTRLIQRKLKEPKKYTNIYFADFEADSTLDTHKEYLCCVMWIENGKPYTLTIDENEKSSIGERLLNTLKHGSLIYFHNLKYDVCFFKNVEGWESNAIERNGTVLQLTMSKKESSDFTKRLTFMDSFSIIPSKLANFGDMFSLKVHKEIFAYSLYTESNRKKRILPVSEFMNVYDMEQIKYHNKSQSQLEADHVQLIENAKISKSLVNQEGAEYIDIMKYAKFYCLKDCEVLMKGFLKFNKDLMNVFKETETPMLPVYNYISISAIGYSFAKQYGCYDECYELSGKPQDFILRCVNGGRTMTARNQKQYVSNGNLQDFDAVSLYPSAMKFMDGVPKGIPHVIPGNVSESMLLAYDTFFIEINIKNIKCKSSKPYAFGLIYKYAENGSKLYCNETAEHYYLDKRSFLDLKEYYDFDYEFIRGYYFNDGFNKKINDFIEILFQLRLRYKKEKNPLQNTIKLLLNSIYGKSILKPIECETKCVPKKKLYAYIHRNYNYIKEVNECDGIDNVYVKRIKPINKHFNLPQFGASVLSWSKWLMNRVICTAEQNDIPIFYQDTDSMHLYETDVDKLAKIFNEKYGCELIGSQLGQFHCDFDAFEGSVGTIHSRKLIALGKKSYLDILVDEKGNEGHHIRMKGIPNQVILNKCKHMGITVEELYERMYKCEAITFDLLDGSNCFRKNKFYQMKNEPKFTRTLKFK